MWPDRERVVMGMIKQNASSREPILRLIIETLAAAGLDAPRLLAHYRIDPSALESRSAVVLNDALNKLWSAAENETGNPAVGLSIPSQAGYGLGNLTQLVVSAGTLRGALRALARHARLLCPTLSINLCEAEGQFRIQLILSSGPGEAVPHRHDFLSMLLVQHMRVLTGSAFELQAYDRPGAAPSTTGPWESVFECPVHFSADRCTLTLSAHELDYALPSANSTVHDFCEYLVSRTEVSDQKTSVRVRRVLEEVLSRGEPSREEIASRLCLSSRSLSRRLASEGTSFAVLVNEVRRDFAELYLKRDEFNLNEISCALGFCDPSNFYRACKRWFGRTPQMVRQEACKTAVTLSSPCARANRKRA